MDKKNLKKLALLGVTSGLVLSVESQANAAVVDVNNATPSTYLAAQCGSGTCGGKSASNSRTSSSQGYYTADNGNAGAQQQQQQRSANNSYNQNAAGNKTAWNNYSSCSGGQPAQGYNNYNPGYENSGCNYSSQPQWGAQNNNNYNSQSQWDTAKCTGSNRPNTQPSGSTQARNNRQSQGYTAQTDSSVPMGSSNGKMSQSAMSPTSDADFAKQLSPDSLAKWNKLSSADKALVRAISTPSGAIDYVTMNPSKPANSMMGSQPSKQ